MRRPLLIALGVGLLASSTALGAYAQSSQREDDAKRAAQDEADKKKKQKEKEWNLSTAPLPDVKNAGPCPYVKVLYDASRYVELKDGREASSAVGYTGEIQNLNSDCRYKNTPKAIEPISVKMNINFALGRGPQAGGDTHDYRYWVAVTGPKQIILAKSYFDLPVRFLAGQDRVQMSQLIDTISIPRAGRAVSGSNFEVLVGFDVTPAMADFNRDGKRFRVNSGVETAAAAN